MNLETIRQLEDLILLEDGEKMEKINISRLTAPGENYGSLMLAVDITVDGPDGTRELNTVAKLIPPNDFIQEMFCTQITFRNEIAFYKTIVPALQEFQRQHGVKRVIDCFPKCYGGRINLNPSSSVIDKDAVLLLENIKVLNYVNLDRVVGFEFDSAKLVLKDLAHLHAVSIALKIERPEIFRKSILPYLTPVEKSDDLFISIRKAITKLAASIPELRPFLKRIDKSVVMQGQRSYKNVPPNEPFASVIHRDCWVNNTMVQFENNKAVNNKLVDFQICEYGSPAKDVLFFLFSSVKNNVLEKHYTDFVNYYYENFIQILSDFPCDLDHFSFQNFQSEIENAARSFEFFHLMYILFPIFRPKGSVKELSEIEAEDLVSGEPTQLHKEKMTFIVKEFSKKNWI